MNTTKLAVTKITLVDLVTCIYIDHAAPLRASRPDIADALCERNVASHHDPALFAADLRTPIELKNAA